MNNLERFLAVLNYEKYDRLPILSFGFWPETINKWIEEGHLKKDDSSLWYTNINGLTQMLGFDFSFPNTYPTMWFLDSLKPHFEQEVLEVYPDGKQKVIKGDGTVVIVKPGVQSIPSQVDYLLKDRKSWEEHFLPRLQFSEDRINKAAAKSLTAKRKNRTEPLGIYCGSLFGQIRNWMGVEGISYLYVDDFDLYKEIIDTVGDLCYKMVEANLKLGIEFDFAHFWEDICFKNGPLVTPSVFRELVGPHYKRITDLLNSYGINIISCDCDGFIDALVPIWLENGVNTMFPIEVGTWNGNIGSWREEYGKEIRGVGGINKNVFAEDYAAADREIERLRPLIDLGGFIPCTDHHIPPTAKWENIQYFCDKLRKIYS